MKRTTLVNPEEPSAGGRGSLKLFFGYAPYAGAATAMLDELRGAAGAGKDVFVAEMDTAGGGTAGSPFEVEHVLKRRPDLVAIDGLARENPPEARNRYRWQDVVELLHAGIDVYAALLVTELDNEHDRASIIANRSFDASVPDRLFYTAQQVEFVDIDPHELQDRCRASGYEVIDLRALRQLRLLALQCVSQYAATSGAADVGRDKAGTAVYGPRDRVVALVSPDASPTVALREAAALAGPVHAPLQALCVRPETRGGSARARAEEEAAVARLAERVEAMGFELVVLFGADAAQVVRDYARAQGVSDIVMVRRPTSLPRRLLLPVVPTLVDRVSEGLLGVRVHVVADDVPAGRARPVARRGLEALLDARPGQVLGSAALTALVTAVLVPLSLTGLSSEGAFLVYLLLVVLVAGTTRGYLPSLVAVALSCVAEALLSSPPLLLVVEPGAVAGLVMMAAVMAVVAFAQVRAGRTAQQARLREQHTQALYELSRSLLYARGMVEVVNLSLDALTRLFDRSAVFYVADPFAPGAADEGRKGSAVRAVAGDFGPEEFARITERSIAHWVFVNGAPAGSGTGTSEMSDIRYLPLLMDDEAIGVIGISAHRPITMGDEAFLEMVCDQILNALERQGLAASHLRDMRMLRLGAIRDDFMGRLVASVNQSTGTVAEVSRMLLAQREPSEEYRDVLEQAVSGESLRARIMMNQALAGAQARPDDPECELRSVVSRAVERARAGRGSTVVELEPGDETGGVLADAALIEVATSLLLEASLAFAPVGGIVTVSVREHPERVTVSVADDRPDPLASQPAAFSPKYDAERARALLDLLADRKTLLDPQEGPAAMARAMRVPLAACMVDGKVDQRRLARIDRIEYGLHVASMIVAAHGGETKMRHRLGGGAVTSLSLPRG